MRFLAAIAVGAALLATSVLAQGDPASMARRAIGQLEAAQSALEAAEKASDRIRALTQTIRAYENGLVALRAGLRRAAIREVSLKQSFDTERERISRLLGVLQSIESAPVPLLLLHPSGPIKTVQSGMIVAEIAPALQRQAEALRTQLEEIALMKTLQDSAISTLQDGLSGAQRARTDLSLAISGRTDLPKRFLSDPAALIRLINSSETLNGFASGLADLKSQGAPAPYLDFEDARGTLPLPVTGTVIRRAGEKDAAGIARPGVVIATSPRALVTTPWAATIRYLGPLLDYGNVIILEPDQRYLLVLAGLDQVYGQPGDVLPPGSPVGLMGGVAPDSDVFLTQVIKDGGVERSETLYMELRQGDAPVDPAIWFAFE
jgi:septal ring factor EnvC (AmiA/AmiB activator)